MIKGIWMGNGLDFYYDLPILKELGFSAVYIGEGDYSPYQTTLKEKFDRYEYAKSIGFTTFVTDISYNYLWKKTVDEIDSQYYYIDEPYAVPGRFSEEDLIERLNYIKIVRPNSKFVIGDIRKIQEKKYKPIDGLYYTYTSYTDNWLIPIIDKAIPIGFGNQSPAIKRVYKQVNGKMPFVWIYGQNKLLCHPDEYHLLEPTCNELGINLMMLYVADGGSPNSKYTFNRVSRQELDKNIEHFLNGTKPYTISQWWKRFFNRLSLSFNRLFKTWDFKEFIDKLF